MHWLAVFGCGFGGSAAVEVVTLFQLYHQHQHDHQRLPARYRKTGFWVVRVLLAVAGGGLAVAYAIDSPLLALNIGAATPSILTNFARGVRDEE